MNGALCHESTIPGQFVCLCPPFYTGQFCYQHSNPCDLLNEPCRNNATCLISADCSHHCICREVIQATSLLLLEIRASDSVKKKNQAKFWEHTHGQGFCWSVRGTVPKDVSSCLEEDHWVVTTCPMNF